MRNAVHLRCYFFFVGSNRSAPFLNKTGGYYSNAVYRLTFMVDFQLGVRINSNLHPLIDQHWGLYT